MGLHVVPFPLSAQSPPVETPTLVNQFQAPEGWPPPQPLENEQTGPEQHAFVSSGENTKLASPVAMQYRSLNASVLPNAQHDTQSIWSRTRPVTEEHSGQAVRTSNDFGISPLAVLKVPFSKDGAE